jgi:hypothetical protein
VYYGSGVDSGSSVYLNGNCRSDFADIRFTSSDCLTLLSYWTETVSESNYATFWVKITDDLSTNPATIYLYYDNPTATSTSNGAATFLIYQDIVADIRSQLGITDLTSYQDGFDPGVDSSAITPIDGAFAARNSRLCPASPPCFSLFGGKHSLSRRTHYKTLTLSYQDTATETWHMRHRHTLPHNPNSTRLATITKKSFRHNPKPKTPTHLRLRSRR